jgi:hypothetical protein
MIDTDIYMNPVSADQNLTKFSIYLVLHHVSYTQCGVEIE